MNNKGFTMMEILAAIVIVGIILIFIYPSITEISKKNSDEKYKSYEKMMVEYAMISKDRNKEIIKLSELSDLDIIINPDSSNKECRGYVIIDHTVTPNTYKAYISCSDKYKTSGYNANLE